MVKNKIFAIDFDNTIAREDCYPEVGKLLPYAKQFINRLYKDGAYIIIWTSRDSDTLYKVVDFLFDNEIFFHKINESNPALLEKYQNNPRKIGADWYFDDKTPGLRLEDGTFDWLEAMRNFYDFDIISYYSGNDLVFKNLEISKTGEIL